VPDASQLKLAVVGAGAIGGLLAARLARVGSVTLLARGAQLDAIRAHGLQLIENGQTTLSYPTVSNDPAACGRQDIVFVCLKGPALVESAPSLAPLIGPQTRVVSLMNGVPWWFFHRFGDTTAGHRLESVDPGGIVSDVLPPSRCFGCLAYLASSLQAPGVIAGRTGNQLVLGAAQNAQQQSMAEIAALLQAAGFEVEPTAQIQHKVWAKLWGNITMNPISAVTGATADLILDDPLTLNLVNAVMHEAREIGARLGIDLNLSIDARNAQTRALGAFKTSMLQDVENRRPLEIDGILEAPREIAQLVGVSTPYLDLLCGLARQKAAVMGLYRPH
jgi:2-dehydropantoate 2-reductase